VSAQSAHLTLRPDRCNQCGKCIAVCPNDAVRVGDSYILVDWNACNHCCACVEACDRNAICREVVPLRSHASASVAPDDVTKVVVGSRAEAKAVRKAAGQAVRQVASPIAHSAGGAAAPDDRPRPNAVAVRRPRAVPSAPAAPRGESDVSGLRLGNVEWTLTDLSAILGALLLTIIGKNALLAIPALSLMPAAGRAGARAAILATYYAVQLGALAFLAVRHGSSLRLAFGLRVAEHSPDAAAPDAPGTPAPAAPAPAPAALANAEKLSPLSSAGLVVALLFGVEFVAIAYGLAAQAIGWRQPLTLSSDVASVFGVGGVGLVLSAVLVAIVAPIAEELAFRGLVLPVLGDRWGMWPAIGVSSVLFAAYHLNAWLFLPMLVFGVALGWLTWNRRSLWPSIALHVLYNGLAVAAAFWVPK
jgi:membrane protease YdiL (CAAX protease family)/NAD-dependent dihydropyrimidine dehydrogenase PreA subunit